MNFIAQVEEHLRDLGTEARKKHPGVKEASERAILQLRSLQNAYVTAVRKATQTGGTHPTTELFQSQDLLRPFLLAANYPNASHQLLQISLSAMSLLIEGHAICPGDGIHMVRVWTIQANVCASSLRKHHSTSASQKTTNTATTPSSSSWFGGMLSSSVNDVSSSSGQGGGSNARKESEKVALELLSCLIQLLELNLPVTDEQWASSVALCCILWQVEKSSTVRQAAKLTLHQVLGLLFQESCETSVETWHDLLSLASTEESDRPLKGAFSHCTGSGPEPPSPQLCLELMHSLLSQQQPDWLCQDRSLMDPTVDLTKSKLTIPDASLESLFKTFQLARALLTSAADEETSAELIATLVKGIVAATEACRNNHDFEDGFIYMEPPPVTTKKSSQKSVTLIPTNMLWKAGLALETLLVVFSSPPGYLLEDARVVAVVAEAISDFATVGASCKGHMLQLVECAGSEEREPDTIQIQPTMFRGAEEAIKGGSTSGEGSNGSHGTVCNMGEALWISFHCILRLLKSLSTGQESSPIEGCFAPSLAVFQHYLKRFPGSSTIVQCALEGYLYLAKVAVPIACGRSLLRKALLASLCKLSLPSWGLHDSSCQLQDRHVESLLCLLKILHEHYDSILSDWNMVLWTFQELSILSISSSLLSDEGYTSALAISSTFARIAPLSTCVSAESLTCIIDALADISTSLIDQGEILDEAAESASRSVEPANPRADSADVKTERRSSDSTEAKVKDSIGGKLMSFAGRTLLGSQTQETTNEDISELPILTPRTKTTFFGSYRQDFLRRLLSSKRAFRNDILGKLPFSLIALTDVALANVYRYKSCGMTISNHFCSLAATSPDIRAHAMDTLAMLVASQLSEDSPTPSSFVGPGRISIVHPMKNQFLVVEAIRVDNSMLERGEGYTGQEGQNEYVSQADLISPLCTAIRTTENYELAEAGISALHSILEGAGHNMNGDVWAVLIEAITSLSGDVSKVQVDGLDRSGSEWATCSMLAFRCLKLVVDDFLDQFPPPSDSPLAARTALLDCCSSFGSSWHDVNTSLTAIGLLWSIADQDSNSWSIDRALSQLVCLSADDRTEVRNCAVNTLFSCIVGRGQGFSAQQWEVCISQTILGVYDRVLLRRGEAETGSIAAPKPTGGAKKSKSGSDRYKVSVHHSRDSAGKQWAITEVMVLQGLSRVLRNFFPQLLESTDSSTEYDGVDHDPAWFEKAWTRILDFALGAAKQSGSRETLDLRSAGVDLLVQCCQLTSRAGIQAASTPARVGTNMEVVNGALRTVNEPSSKASGKDIPQKVASEEVDNLRRQFFLAAFDDLVHFRAHLEDEVHADVASELMFLETVQVQVLHKLALGLGKLYECCKDDEFAPAVSSRIQRRPSRILRYLDLSSEKELLEDDLEGRFIHMVAAVAKIAVSDPDARFLTQAQRAALDLLRLMSSQSSDEALRVLASIGGQSFFLVVGRDADEGDDSSATDAAGVELLSYEAAKAVAEEMSNEKISDETRVQILCRVLSDVIGDKKSGNMEPKGLNKKRSYKLFVPVLESGLRSAARIEENLSSSARDDEGSSSSQDGERIDEKANEGSELLEHLWEKVALVLAGLFTPVQSPSNAPYIPRVNSLLAIVNAVASNAPKKHHDDICMLLSSGASTSVEVAELQTAVANDGSMTAEERRKSQTRREEALKIYEACFSGLCRLQPQSPTLRSLTSKVLEDALSQETSDAVSSNGYSLCTDVAAVTCQAISDNVEMERLVISIFSLLCKLISVNNADLRGKVARILRRVDVGQILEEATTRFELAEERALEAEEHIQELVDEIEDLHHENESLSQQIAVYSASSALS